MKAIVIILGLLASTCLLLVPTARSQEIRIDALSSKRDVSRFGPATRCDDSTPLVTLARDLRLSLSVLGKQLYKVGDTLIFDLTITNSGNVTVAIPAQACSEESVIAHQSGVISACINLNYRTPAGEEDWFTGPCLCGREDAKNLRNLKPRESMVVHGNSEILLDSELFSATYNAEKPILVLTPDLDFSLEFFPPGKSKAIDGCVEDIPTRIEADSKASIQVVAAPRDRKESLWDAPSDPN